jgi:enterochelin esterase-like enzyme
MPARPSPSARPRRITLASAVSAVSAASIAWAAVFAASLALAEGAPATGELEFRLRTGVPGQRVQLALDFLEWRSERQPMPEVAPGEYALKLPAPWRPRVEYKFVVDGRWIEDPEAKTAVPDGRGGRNSVREISAYREPAELTLKPGTPRHRVRRFTVPDPEGIPRTITVLLPRAATRARQGEPGPTLYFQDGEEYLTRARAGEVLANLSFGPAAPALTGVFIPPRERAREYGREAPPDDYVRFLAEVVVPEVERRYFTGGAPDRRLVLGPSLGGLVSLHAALTRPEVFGRAASQSGALWVGAERIVDELRDAGPGPWRLHLEAGVYESALITGSNRRFCAEARALVDRLSCREYPVTHDWPSWRDGLPALIRSALELPAAGPALSEPASRDRAGPSRARPRRTPSARSPGSRH